jgi:hypothetical protein
MIHHEVITARTVTDEEAAAGIGCFDVIEMSPRRFIVADNSGMTLSESRTLLGAIRDAKREAAAYDRRVRDERKRERQRFDLSARNLERFGLRRGAYNGSNSRRFVLFEAARSTATGEAVEIRREFTSKRERDAKALELLAAAVDHAAA